MAQPLLRWEIGSLRWLEIGDAPGLRLRCRFDRSGGPNQQVTILAATHRAANVKTVGQGQTHLLHLSRFPDGWSIADGIWAFDGGVIANATYDI